MGALALSQTAWLAAALAAAGACTGVLAGLFGVGGGTIIVPVLYEVFGLYGMPEEIRMPLCIGTSLAVIVPTSISSFLGHYKKGAVDVGVLRLWAVPIIAGVTIGVVTASLAKPILFKIVFIGVSLFLAVRLLAGKDKWSLGDKLPGAASMRGYGLIIGSSASLMGIGGGLVANIVLGLYKSPYPCDGSHCIGRWADRVPPGGARLCGDRLGSAGLPAFVARLCIPDRVCAAHALSLLTVRYGVNLAHS